MLYNEYAPTDHCLFLFFGDHSGVKCSVRMIRYAVLVKSIY